MCAIFGAVLRPLTEHEAVKATEIMKCIMEGSKARGRDGYGFAIHAQDECVRTYRFNQEIEELHWSIPAHQHIKIIGNSRGEPTTEYVEHKKLQDQQPYFLNKDSWHIVHNGTIANDKELRTYSHGSPVDSTAILELFEETLDSDAEIIQCVKRLKGSYAILASHPHHVDELFVACNYKPIWYVQTEYGLFFASQEWYFPPRMTSKMVEPYSASFFGHQGYAKYVKGESSAQNLYSENANDNKKALVICSGGLDSVVAATYAQKELGLDVKLLHFKYGSRAEGREVNAIRSIAEYLGVGLRIQDLPIYERKDSPLLNLQDSISQEEAGAEFAHEWVPARNLVMLSIATAIAEAQGFGTLVLGNNLEEAGAYPDNEPEFINKFNKLLPFAVADGKRIRVIMPVGNLMKHEIVKLGNKIGAPLHLTWSCYQRGEHHCGTCGPCYMRKKAFKINKLEDPVTHEA